MELNHTSQNSIIKTVKSGKNISEFISKAVL